MELNSETNHVQILEQVLTGEQVLTAGEQEVREDTKINEHVTPEITEQIAMDKSNIDNLIIEFCTNERRNIQFERTNLKNISKAFRGVGDFGEELTTHLFPGSFGSASKGGCAFDNIELGEENNEIPPLRKISMAREVKTCCQIQPKKCVTCGNKAPYYQPLCVFCKGTEFKEIKDTRFGIDSKAHFKYQDMLKEYVMIIVDYNNITENISMKIYKINSSNEYFTNYLLNQKDNSGSSTCNLLPYSYDFYGAGPIMLLDYDIDTAGHITEKFFNLDNKMSIDFDLSTLTRAEKEKLGFSVDTPSVAYADIVEQLKLRNKKLNKPRGTTTRL